MIIIDKTFFFNLQIILHVLISVMTIEHDSEV